MKAKSPSSMTSKSSSSNVQILPKSQPQGRPAATPTKPKPKANQSILSFFKKEASSPQPFATLSSVKEDALFFDPENIEQREQIHAERVPEPSQIPTPPSDQSSHCSEDPPEETGDTARYNEKNTPIKRRRVGTTPIGFLRPKIFPTEDSHHALKDQKQTVSEQPQGGSNNQEVNPTLSPEAVNVATVDLEEPVGSKRERDEFSRKLDTSEREEPGDSIHPVSSIKSCQEDEMQVVNNRPSPEPPSLKRESTSYIDIDDFEGVDDFIDDEFPEEGEEYQERQWMDEQFLQEQDLEGDPESVSQEQGEPVNVNSSEAFCPICNIGLAGIKDEVETIMVFLLLYVSNIYRMSLYTSTIALTAILPSCHLLPKRSPKLPK